MINIETIHDITPDILHDISVQLQSGLQSGHLPYKWSIKQPPTIENQILDDIDDYVETAIEAIRNTERSFERLRELLSNP